MTQAFETAIIHARDDHLVSILGEEVARASPGAHLAVVYAHNTCGRFLRHFPRLGLSGKTAHG
jgi:hypothetical protein